MVPNAPTLRLFLVAFCLLVFDLCCAHPTPYPHTSTVFPRQESNLTSPMTITKTDRITTGAGTFIHTCKITLTAIVVDGVKMVREEKTCTTTPDNGNGNVPGALPPGSSPPVSAPSPSSTPPPLTSTSDTLSPTPAVTGSPPAVTDSPPAVTDSPPAVTDSPPAVTSSPPAVTSSPPAGPGSVPPPALSTSLTSVPRPGPNDLVPPSPSSTNTSSVPVSPTATPVGAIETSSAQGPTVTPTQSSDNAGAATPLDLPGKKLEVLPIGLGVFAGVSVIALLVVGIVTYERTKHRRNFRKLRLEETGSRMGYGAA